jgi:hypothetical protein
VGLDDEAAVGEVAQDGAGALGVGVEAVGGEDLGGELGVPGDAGPAVGDLGAEGGAAVGGQGEESLAEEVAEVLGDLVADDLAEAGALGLDRRFDGGGEPALADAAVEDALEAGAVALEAGAVVAAQGIGVDVAAAGDGFLQDALGAGREGEVVAVDAVGGPEVVVGEGDGGVVRGDEVADAVEVVGGDVFEDEGGFDSGSRCN